MKEGADCRKIDVKFSFQLTVSTKVIEGKGLSVTFPITFNLGKIEKLAEGRAGETGGNLTHR